MIIIVETTNTATIEISDDVLDLPRAERNDLLWGKAENVDRDQFEENGLGFRFFTEDGEELT